MQPLTFLNTAYRPAMAILPPYMNSQAAAAQILAICLQESNLAKRKQLGGPARGYSQFELGGGITEVLTNTNTAAHARAVLKALDYPTLTTAADCYIIIEHNDVLDAAFCRLLLWTIRPPLPPPANPERAWRQYIDAWHPGIERRGTWNSFYFIAWAAVDGAEPLI